MLVCFFSEAFLRGRDIAFLFSLGFTYNVKEKKFAQKKQIYMQKKYYFQQLNPLPEIICFY